MSIALQMVLKYIFRLAKTQNCKDLAFPTTHKFIHNTIIVISVAIKGKNYSVVNLMIYVD